GPLRDIPDLLDLEELDTNLYRARNEDGGGWPTLFGGQVAAQALMAAARTVPEGRTPHSLHGYFLRPGRPDHAVILQVARDRDGRSFSARHVVAIQRNEVIFSMSTSFHHGESGAQFVSERPLPPTGPDDLEETVIMARFEPMLRLKPFPLRVPTTELDFPVPSRMWARTVGALSDDPIVHACALTYLSDVGSGFAESEVADLPRGGPSLDHSLWFHQPIRLDDWVLLDTWPLKAGGGRGLYAGSIHDRAGTLGAMLTQETLLRHPRRR
ncbi:MAG: acyl-CoA thioesterase, partial [Acidimicrobiales bacterium]